MAMDFLANKRILLGVSGGIAAYKAVDLLRRMMEQGATVKVVMSQNATRFVTPLTFEAISGREVALDLFEQGQETKIGHVRLSQGVDAVVVAPATANLIAKAACGLADDFLSTALLATTAPVLLAPSMNSTMFAHPTVQENLTRLKKHGVNIIAPEVGFLACGDEGRGRLASSGAILDALGSLLSPGSRPLQGVKALVTSGPTLEAIDPVRSITNRSSGRMGHALCQALLKAGAEVTLVSGPVALEPPQGVDLVSVQTALQMDAAVQSRMSDVKIIIGCAAVGDFRVEKPAEQKIKKGQGMTLHLVPNPDIIARVAKARQKGQVLVGFAAETHELIQNAQKKLQDKGLDLVVANDISRADAGFDSEQNLAVLVDRSSSKEVGLLSKQELAQRIVDRIIDLAG